MTGARDRRAAYVQALRAQLREHSEARVEDHVALEGVGDPGRLKRAWGPARDQLSEWKSPLHRDHTPRLAVRAAN